MYVLAVALLPVGVGVGLHKGNGQREICTVCINYLTCGVNLVDAGGFFEHLSFSSTVFQGDLASALTHAVAKRAFVLSSVT